MSAAVAALPGLIGNHPGLIWSAVFLVAASEALVVVGALVPGTPLLVALGIAASTEPALLAGAVVAATLGAVAGDGLSFWIGHRHSARLLGGWPFARRPALLAQGRAFVHRFGVAGVALARFLPGVRALVPVVAGIFGMRPSAFYAANVASAMVWAPIHILPGALIGMLVRLHLTDDLDDFVAPAGAAIGLALWFLWRRRRRPAGGGRA